MPRRLRERNNAGTPLKDAVSDVLTFGAFTALVEAWNKNPDPKQVWWEPLTPVTVNEALGYDSVKACQDAVDSMRGQLHRLSVCGEVCLVRNEVINELKVALGR